MTIKRSFRIFFTFEIFVYGIQLHIINFPPGIYSIANISFRIEIQQGGVM